ncbi:hypothetical protein BH11CYA1_BH11CYA1_39220 [soil metagenome]
MTSSYADDEAREREPWVSRRSVLKFIAGAPLVFTFGMVASPLARFFKPTMKPGAFFQVPDMPKAVRSLEFSMADFPADWSTKQFDFQIKHAVFNPEQEQIRTIPGIAVRTAPGKVVAFSRLCPLRGCLLEYRSQSCCGCVNSVTEVCNCAMKKEGGVLVCPRHLSVFDLSQDGRVVAGTFAWPPRRFNLFLKDEVITISGLDSVRIS